jgi:hypothetical protein
MAIDKVLEALTVTDWAAEDSHARGELLSTTVMPMFVPSKGRATSSELLNQHGGELKAENVPVVVAVEASEAHAYAIAHPWVVLAVMPWGGGIGYVVATVSFGAHCNLKALMCVLSAIRCVLHGVVEVHNCTI